LERNLLRESIMKARKARETTLESEDKENSPVAAAVVE
jgi:hypothetical protein